MIGPNFCFASSMSSFKEAINRKKPIKENATKDTKISNHLLIQGCSVSVPFAILIVSISISSRLSCIGSIISVIAACLTSWLGTYVMLDLCRFTKSQGNLDSGLYAVIRELLAFMTSWVELLVRGSMVGVAGRTLSHTVDLVVGPSLHNTVIQAVPPLAVRGPWARTLWGAP